MYIEFKKRILHVKLTVQYTVSFTYNIYFLNSTYFSFMNWKVTNFHISFAVEYIFAKFIYFFLFQEKLSSHSQH